MNTEEEAKQRWCPHKRVASHYGPLTVAINWFRRTEPSTGEIELNCIASECMMWRAYQELADNPKNDFDLVDSNRGYCGLAGKP